MYRITHDCEAAKDAVQEALLRAWKNMARFKGQSQFYTWLTRIGINEAHRGMGRRREQLSLDDPQASSVAEATSRDPGPESLHESREFLDAVAVALGRLPADYQDAVRLRDVEGLSTREAAGQLEIGEQALKSRLHRGRVALHESLEGHFTA